MGTQLRRGLLVSGRYRLEARLGSGGMGDVWSATKMLVGQNQMVALKFLTRSAAERSIREARAALAHPHIATVFDLDYLDERTPFLVMELLRGQTLRAHLGQVRKLCLSEMATMMGQVVSAVGMVHAYGIVHRDLKPENIFLMDAPRGSVAVKVLDFGLAKFIGRNPGATQRGITAADASLGTPGYAAPEQLRCNERVGIEADVWAVGVMACECLLGRPPFPVGDFLEYARHCGSPPAALDDAMLAPYSVRDLLRRILSVQPERRPILQEVFRTLMEHAECRAPGFPAPLSRTMTASSDSALEPTTSGSDPAHTMSTDPSAMESLRTSGRAPLRTSDPDEAASVAAEPRPSAPHKTSSSRAARHHVAASAIAGICIALPSHGDVREWSADLIDATVARPNGADDDAQPTPGHSAALRAPASAVSQQPSEVVDQRSSAAASNAERSSTALPSTRPTPRQSLQPIGAPLPLLPPPATSFTVSRASPAETVPLGAIPSAAVHPPLSEAQSTSTDAMRARSPAEEPLPPPQQRVSRNRHASRQNMATPVGDK